MLLKIFWNFRTTSRKRSTQKQPFSGVLQGRCPEKIGKFHKKTPVLETVFSKVSRNKETPAEVFSCEFCEAFKNTFFTEHLWWSWSLSFKMLYIVGVRKKVFEWLAAHEFLSNSKNHLRFSYISIFSITCFFNEFNRNMRLFEMLDSIIRIIWILSNIWLMFICFKRFILIVNGWLLISYDRV